MLYIETSGFACLYRDFNDRHAERDKRRYICGVVRSGFKFSRHKRRTFDFTVNSYNSPDDLFSQFNNTYTAIITKIY